MAEQEFTICQEQTLASGRWEAGAIPETVEIIDVEDIPPAYYPGNTNRVKIKAAGDLGKKA